MQSRVCGHRHDRGRGASPDVCRSCARWRAEMDSPRRGVSACGGGTPACAPAAHRSRKPSAGSPRHVGRRRATGAPPSPAAAPSEGGWRWVRPRRLCPRCGQRRCPLPLGNQRFDELPLICLPRCDGLTGVDEPCRAAGAGLLYPGSGWSAELSNMPIAKMDTT